MNDGAVSAFLKRNFQHFNAATLIDAANAYRQHLDAGGKMLVTLAGAMSTAELGISLAEMIRQGKVHGICCTGANLEEDLFNLIAHDSYKRLPHYRDLTAIDEAELFENNLNRVTDTCIPEAEAIRRVERAILDEWRTADSNGKQFFPHEFLFRLLRTGEFLDSYEIDINDSWLYAAMERDLPIFVPGWEDSTLGNMFAAHWMLGEIKSERTVRTGLQYLIELANWYLTTTKSSSAGFFQIGGGIAGDFAVCVVPMLREDVGNKEVPQWGYYCQISESTTSYGSYSGAVPNEKITWGKLNVETPKFVIESDASIVAPLVFALILGQ